MKTKAKRITMALLFALSITSMLGQHQTKNSSEISAERKFSVSTTWLTFLNFGSEKTNTHHYEFHFGYQVTPKDKIGIKTATWKLFSPMGIPMWDPSFRDESEFFAGRLSECGIGVTYQRMIWKGLFATVEVLPLYKTYLDENNKEIGDGFKLYATFHAGYHFRLFKNRMFIEPQIQCNYWPIDTKAPQSFQISESKWNNYFLFEPNLYIGFKF